MSAIKSRNSLDLSNIARVNLNAKNARFRMLRSTSLEIENVGDLTSYPKMGPLNQMDMAMMTSAPITKTQML